MLVVDKEQLIVPDSFETISNEIPELSLVVGIFPDIGWGSTGGLVKDNTGGVESIIQPGKTWSFVLPALSILVNVGFEPVREEV